jgi:hypothetical protein
MPGQTLQHHGRNAGIAAKISAGALGVGFSELADHLQAVGSGWGAGGRIRHGGELVALDWTITQAITQTITRRIHSEDHSDGQVGLGIQIQALIASRGMEEQQLGLRGCLG